MEEESCNQAPYDIENPYIPLVTSIVKDLDSLSPLSSECCIYKVPERLRQASEDAYTPKVVSIGPLHHGKEGLNGMEEHKKRYLHSFLVRTQVSLEDYVKKIKDQEARLCSCYAEPIKLSSDEFVIVILVDTSFIIEMLLKYSFPELREENDRIFNKSCLLQDVWPDMQLLENQLPFFILDDLFEVEKVGISSKSNSSERLSMTSLSEKFVKFQMQTEGVDQDCLKRISKADHFVDFIRTLCLPSKFSHEVGGRLKTVTTLSMRELNRAGVKFKVGSGKNLFDIRFTGGVLEIPKLTLSDETWITIRNLLAFEQCQCIENYVYDYVFLMKCFMRIRKDVELLMRHGIVENRLGDSTEGCILINNLADGVIMDPSYLTYFCFASLCEDLQKYCKKSPNRLRANLIKHFFNSPWATKEMIATVIFLLLTVSQAVCSLIMVIRG